MKERPFKYSSGSAAVEDPPTNGRPIVAIFREMVAHLSEIVRSEILLVSLEAKSEIAERKNAAISIVVANMLLLYAGGFVLLGAVYALSTVWPAWLSAISVGAAVGLIGAVLLSRGVKSIKNPKST